MCWEVCVLDRHEFLVILTDQIRTKRARPMILREMEAHIEDQKRAFMSEGMTDAEAEEAAVREMGDPVEAGVALDRVHRPKMQWSVLAGVLFISILGLVLQAVVAVAAHPPGFSFSWMLTADGIGKQLLFTAAGLVLMLVICWMDYTFIDRHAVILWIVINVLLLLCAMESPVINGRPFYLMHASCLIIPFYAGIQYHFRGQGSKGMAKSFLCLCIPMVILYYYYMISIIFILGAAGMILLHAAIYKKWFGEKRKRLYLKLWGMTALAAAFLMGIWMLASGGRGLAEYQMARILAWLHIGNQGGASYSLVSAAEAGQHVKEGAVYLTVNTMEEIRSSYLWIYLFRYLGTWRGLLITALVLGFWVYLFHVVRRQKNQFGYMVSLGCVLFLSIQTVMYIGMNFGIVPLGATYMPFISNGGAFLMISYFYMGILLSVCNNSKVELGTGYF